MADVPVCFIDTETLGLDPERHAIWEVAFVLRRPGDAPVEASWVIELEPDLISMADPTALRLNGFYDRYYDAERTAPEVVALEVARATVGASLVGAVPSFDERRLDGLLRSYGCAPAWHHRLVCVETLAAGRLGIRAGWDPAQLSEMLGIERPEATKHTALGDARWAMRMYDAVFSVPPKPERAPTKKAAPKVEEAPVSQAEPEEPADDKEPVVDKRAILADLQSTGGTCEECKTDVPPSAAVMSFTRHGRVLCMAGDKGGCYARFGVAS